MPLMKSASKDAVGSNIKAEEHAGKPLAQSLAIALEIQRRAKKKHMAMGGMVEDDESAPDHDMAGSIADAIMSRSMDTSLSSDGSHEAAELPDEMIEDDQLVGDVPEDEDEGKKLLRDIMMKYKSV